MAEVARSEPLLQAPEPESPVAVCVVDSGVNLTPDLAPVVTARLAYDGGDPGDTYPQPNGYTGHGTYVASFIAAQVNGWGSSGHLAASQDRVGEGVPAGGGCRERRSDVLRVSESAIRIRTSG